MVLQTIGRIEDFLFNVGFDLVSFDVGFASRVVPHGDKTSHLKVYLGGLLKVVINKDNGVIWADDKNTFEYFWELGEKNHTQPDFTSEKTRILFSSSRSS